MIYKINGKWRAKNPTHADNVKRFKSKYTELGPNECWDDWDGARDTDGYGRFSIKRNGRQREIRAHVFALELRLGRELREGKQSCHICDNPACVNPNHLVERTAGWNSRDMTKKGRQAKGEKNGSVKLNERVVRWIRRKYKKTDCPILRIVREVKRLFGVVITGTQIQRILFGGGWKHVGGPLERRPKKAKKIVVKEKKEPKPKQPKYQRVNGKLRIECICFWCEKEFISASKCQEGKKRFCSEKCKNDYKYKQSREKLCKKVCPECGKEFEGVRQVTYCSHKCGSKPGLREAVKANRRRLAG